MLHRIGISRTLDASGEAFYGFDLHLYGGQVAGPASWYCARARWVGEVNGLRLGSAGVIWGPAADLDALARALPGCPEEQVVVVSDGQQPDSMRDPRVYWIEVSDVLQVVEIVSEVGSTEIRVSEL